jgi:Protein of unknown function (DUF3106)
MAPSASRKPGRRRQRVALSVTTFAAAAALTWSSLSGAQNPTSPAHPAVKPLPEQGTAWSELKPAQQATLRPLEREWPAISAQRKQKWLELVERYPRMTEPERERISQRMAEWVRMSPQERSQARLNFQEAKQLPAEDRQARWSAYQALSPEQKQQLAERATPAAEAARKPAPTVARPEKSARELPQAKSNLVTNPTFEARPTPLSPTVVQARPGASTTLITKRPTPPSHQQTGLPKIAATPEFVNKTTLLPQRGPQGAATQSAAAPTAEAATRR